METRLNKYIAQHSDYSRRTADQLIADGRVSINGDKITTGRMVTLEDAVAIDGRPLIVSLRTETALFNKPMGYVCSRNGQGSETIYDILPEKYRHLNSVGRLDKDSSGLLILTNDGELANRLTHPRYQKIKVYNVRLDKPLQPLHQQMISDFGITLDDGPSKFVITKDNDQNLIITMQEGRNRQIRRTFEALGYRVTKLHRTQFGNYQLGNLPLGEAKLAR